MNDLVEYLLNYAFNHGVGYKLIHGKPDQPSTSLPNLKFMVINMNWHNKLEIPFTIGHEIGHIMLGDKGVMYYLSYAGKQSEEQPADLYALHLLYEYSLKHIDGFVEPGQFMKAYGIPVRMTKATQDLFDKEN